jgi:integrase
MHKLKRGKGTGGVSKLSGRRRKPFMALITVGWETDSEGIKHQKKQVIGYFETRKEAVKALNSNETDPVSSRINETLKQIYDKWSALKYSEKLSHDTINNYKAGWNYLLPLYIKKFSELRAGDYQTIIDKAAENRSRSSLEKIKTVVVMLSEYAMQNDIIKQNYGSYIKLPRAERSIKTSFTSGEIDLIEKAAADGIPFADCVLMMCYTGFRITEFLGLALKDYNAVEGTLTGGIKNEAGKNRTVPIHSKITAYVKLWADKGGQRIICKVDGSKYTSKYFRENCFTPVMEQIKDVRKLDPHECRHTFASLLHASHASQKNIMELMGHDDPNVDLQTYIHVDIEQLRQSVDNM